MLLFKILGCFCHQTRKSGLPALDHKRFPTLYVIFGRAAGTVPRLHTQLTIRSSRDRFAVSRVIHSPAAVRLNSGVRRRQTKIFSTWGSPAKRHNNSQSPSATYSVQLESSCTPSVDTVLREQLASAQNQFCAAGLNSFAWTRVRQVSQAKASLVSRLTIRSSRVRFAASDGGSYD